MTKSETPKPGKRPKAPKPERVLQPWDEVPKEPKGDDDPADLYLAVGEALTVWEALDQQQGNIFGILVNSRHGAGEDAYGMIASASARTTMVLAAAEAIFQGERHPLFEELKILVNDIGQLSGRRNDIAHGIVTEFEGSAPKDGVIVKTSYGHYLIPNHTNARKRLSRLSVMAVILQDQDAPPQHFQRYAYTARQVRSYAMHFAAYRLKAMDLMFRIQDYCQQRWPPSFAREQELLQQIHDLQTKLTALEREPPPEPSPG